MNKFQLLTLPLFLYGCGTYTPNIQEFPLSAADGVNLIRGVTQSIECELRRAIVEVIDEDKRVATLNQGVRSATWFDDWGVQLSLTLTIVEGSLATPSINLRLPSTIDPTPNSIIGASLPLSASASRKGSLSYYYLISDLYESGLCTKSTVASLPRGSRLIRSNLKIGEWLQAQALAAGTGAIPVSQIPNAITQTVEFVASYGASAKVTWPAISNTVGAIVLAASGSRKRTHSVTMTFGPANKKKKGLSGSAADAFRAAQIGAEIRSAL